MQLCRVACTSKLCPSRTKHRQLCSWHCSLLQTALRKLRTQHQLVFAQPTTSMPTCPAVSADPPASNTAKFAPCGKLAVATSSLTASLTGSYPLHLKKSPHQL
jgi:hypothetical protein